MGRGRTENNTSRQVTLCAAVLFNAVVALITVVLSSRGRLHYHECASNRCVSREREMHCILVA
jgi:hypothetical protein